MSQFHFGQRVRVVKSINGHLLGREGTVMGSGPVRWPGDIIAVYVAVDDAPSDHATGLWGFATYQLEPIVPPGESLAETIMRMPNLTDVDAPVPA